VNQAVTRFVPLLVIVLMAGCSMEDPAPAAAGTDAATLIPHMPARPVLDRVMTPGEWDAAWTMNGTFVIDDGSNATGEYPFHLWVGADERNVYVAAVVLAGRNPWSELRIDEDGEWDFGSVWYPDTLDLFFTMGLEGGLAVPSDWKSFGNSREQGTRFYDGYWDGMQWVLQNTGPGGGRDFNDGRPAGGTWGRGGYAEDSLFWEISITRAGAPGARRVPPCAGGTLPHGRGIHTVRAARHRDADSPRA